MRSGREQGGSNICTGTKAIPDSGQGEHGKSHEREESQRMHYVSRALLQTAPGIRFEVLPLGHCAKLRKNDSEGCRICFRCGSKCGQLVRWRYMDSYLVETAYHYG